MQKLDSAIGSLTKLRSRGYAVDIGVVEKHETDENGLIEKV